MTCPSCGEENCANARFCLACGEALALVCAHCNARLAPIARFCDQCGAAVFQPVVRPDTAPTTADATAPEQGEPAPKGDPRTYTPAHLATKILTARSALEGERKQVTVLFADVSGFTAISEDLDPEVVHDIMDRCFRILGDEVHRYDGTINQFTGDGIMALFGAPIAHENAPERALRAALGIQAALTRFTADLRAERGIEFQMRIGINTGAVVVGKIGDDLRMDYTAVGDTTNLAARLQSAAPAGAILISDATAKAVTGRFVLQPVGPLRLKGKSRPVAAHLVQRALPRPALGAPSEHGLTPLIGRASELAAIETLLEHACAGRGQIAFVVGEAGIGKSRLIYEFRRRLTGKDILWLQGCCISFGRGIPFLPVIDILKNAFAIDEGDNDETIVAKVAGGIEALDPALQSEEPYLRALLAVDPGDPTVAAMEASARRFATVEALKCLMLTAAARRPLVILVEDLHWLDPPSEECLTYLVDSLAGAPILLLCTYRPGYRPIWGERTYISRLALQPLSREETATMAATMLHSREVPAEIQSLIIEKAEGNPFFVEEVTKSLIEMGVLRRTANGYVSDRPVSEIVIPNTIQDVIMARIDRLGDEPKRAIQIASVIGREFALRLLQRASELGDRVAPLIGELRALELIYEKSGVPELAYMFKHALTHDVAYESLLLQRRKLLHHTIGRAIEELYADRLAEHFETLAHHFLRAEDWPRAFEYLVLAGDKAGSSVANSTALYFYDRALEVAAHLEISAERRAYILERKGRAHFCLSEFPPAIEAYRAAVELRTGLADCARLHVSLGEALMWAHEFDAAVDAAATARALSEQAGVPLLVGEADFVLGFVSMLRGELEASAALHRDASRIAQDNKGGELLLARAQVAAALRANWRGEFGRAIDDCRPLLVELRRANELLALVEVYSHFTIALGGAGAYSELLSQLDAGVELSQSIGDKVWGARMWNTRGWILGELGAYDAAEEANRRCIEFMRQLGSLRFASEFVGNATINLADAALWRGDRRAADAHLGGVAAILADQRNEWLTWRYGMHFNVSAAEHAIAGDDLGRARAHIERALATARRTRSRRYVVRATRQLAACHAAVGNLSEAERLLAVMVGEARGLANPSQLWQTLLAHARVLHRMVRKDEALAAAREGADLTRRIAEVLPAHIQDAFRSSPAYIGLAELSQ